METGGLNGPPFLFAPYTPMVHGSAHCHPERSEMIRNARPSQKTGSDSRTRETPT
jgi:hypothetical protein